ncbi:hypothetical protein IGI04_021931 [Brassica rapa subsp. trilocularis]|uniref:Uncharacterized protein n=1 Tax=Brassica rapa subsp. trilocularis TaxID=1813537 RepID=A0ABQ7LZI0_BRACM|nr:hypothetical protein IGI04_021931 [Brassica rapa subsp. trilocularis]
MQRREENSVPDLKITNVLYIFRGHESCAKKAASFLPTNPTLTEQNARDVESMRKTALDMIHLMNENFVLLISQLTHTSKKTNSMLFFSAMELPSQRWNITCLFCIAEHTSLKLSKLSFNFQHRMQKKIKNVVPKNVFEKAEEARDHRLVDGSWLMMLSLHISHTIDLSILAWNLWQMKNDTQIQT